MVFQYNIPLNQLQKVLDTKKSKSKTYFEAMSEHLFDPYTIVPPTKTLQEFKNTLKYCIDTIGLNNILSVDNNNLIISCGTIEFSTQYIQLFNNIFYLIDTKPLYDFQTIESFSEWLLRVQELKDQYNRLIEQNALIGQNAFIGQAAMQDILSTDQLANNDGSFIFIFGEAHNVAGDKTTLTQYIERCTQSLEDNNYPKNIYFEHFTTDDELSVQDFVNSTTSTDIPSRIQNIIDRQTKAMPAVRDAFIELLQSIKTHNKQVDAYNKEHGKQYQLIQIRGLANEDTSRGILDANLIDAIGITRTVFFNTDAVIKINNIQEEQGQPKYIAVVGAAHVYNHEHDGTKLIGLQTLLGVPAYANITDQEQTQHHQILNNSQKNELYLQDISIRTYTVARMLTNHMRSIGGYDICFQDTESINALLLEKKSTIQDLAQMFNDTKVMKDLYKNIKKKPIEPKAAQSPKRTRSYWHIMDVNGLDRQDLLEITKAPYDTEISTKNNTSQPPPFSKGNNKNR